jgi:hypothetical protein
MIYISHVSIWVHFPDADHRSLLSPTNYKSPTATSLIFNIRTMFFSISILSGLLHFGLVYAALTKDTDVSPPQGGLASNSNYIFVNKDTQNIDNLLVTIAVTEDLHVSSSGLSFRLNCWTPSPKSSSDLVEQQFGLSFDGTNFGAFLSTATLPGSNQSAPALFVDNTTLATDDAASGIIPAGTTITITINNDDNGTVTDGTFGITQGATSTGNIDVAESIPITGATAPIIGFTLVIVGLGNGATGQFTGGQGTVEYSASTSFSPVNALPQGFIFEQVGGTGNCVYGGLSGSEVTDLTQTWNVSS